MRVLRTSAFLAIDLPPMTAVVRDCDLADSIESTTQKMYEPGQFVLHQVFEMPDGDIVSATAEAMRRGDPERESNMAVLYFWTCQHFKMQRPGSPLVIATKDPSPLTADEIETVFEQVVHHPDFNDMILVLSVAEDMREAVRINMGGTVERIAV